MTHTCILRYSSLSLRSDYVIVMHPWSDDFDLISSDIDITRLEQDHKKTLLDAKTAGKQFVKLGDTDYPTKFIEPEGMILHIQNIESLKRQKLANGLVIKAVRYEYDDVNYVGVLRNPSPTNPCGNQTDEEGVPFCNCKNQCTRCYYLENAEKEIHYVPLNYVSKIKENEIVDTKIKAKRSKHCDNSFFSAYNFDSVQMSMLT